MITTGLQLSYDIYFESYSHSLVIFLTPKLDTCNTFLTLSSLSNCQSASPTKTASIFLKNETLFTLNIGSLSECLFVSRPLYQESNFAQIMANSASENSRKWVGELQAVHVSEIPQKIQDVQDRLHQSIVRQCRQAITGDPDK